MMQRMAVVALVAGLLLVSGCGGGDDGAAEEDNASQAEDSEPTTTTEVVATTEQVASAIVSSRAGLLDAIASTDDCFLLSPEFCSQAAQISFFSLDPASQTLLLNLDTLEEEFQIPAEMVDLVDRTRNAIEQMQPTLAQFLDEAQCNTTGFGTRECDAIYSELTFYVGNVQTQLEGWGPYI